MQKGFPPAESNWFKMPIEWINMSTEMCHAEIQVLTFILRHTWGYSEYGKPKKITLDEFENGRKLQDGSRMDKGTGLSVPSIRKGIQEAMKHGLLEVFEDGEDKARMKRYYRLVIHQPGNGEGVFSPDCKKIVPKLKKILGRSEIDTLRKKPLSGRGRPKPAPANPGLISGEWDQEGGRILYRILVRHGSDLVSPAGGKRRGVKESTLSQNFYRLRVERRIPKDRIKEVLRWLDEHYGDDWTPKMRKAGDFAGNWKRYEEAMSRWKADNGDEPADRPEGASQAVGKVRRWLAENKGWNCGDVPWPEDVAEAMEALGLKGGELDPDEV